MATSGRTLRWLMLDRFGSVVLYSPQSLLTPTITPTSSELYLELHVDEPPELLCCVRMQLPKKERTGPASRRHLSSCQSIVAVTTVNTAKLGPLYSFLAYRLFGLSMGLAHFLLFRGKNGPCSRIGSENMESRPCN